MKLSSPGFVGEVFPWTGKEMSGGWLVFCVMLIFVLRGGEDCAAGPGQHQGWRGRGEQCGCADFYFYFELIFDN